MKISLQYSIVALCLTGAFTNCAQNQTSFGKISSESQVDPLGCDTSQDPNCAQPPVVPPPLPTNTPVPPTPPPDTTNPEERKQCSTGFVFGLQNRIENGTAYCDLMEIRYCFDGVLNGTSGNYTSNSCVTKNVSVASSRTCTLDGRTLAHGQNSVFYRRKVISGTSNCVGQIRVCDNGFLTGSDEFSAASCGSSEYKTPDGQFKNCSFNGSVIAEGATTVAYKTPNALKQSDGTWACNFNVRRCIDGKLDGDAQDPYNYSGCN
ncbi:MAG: hypothetical protein RJB66_2568, partial [Pseudomonadota bacterium]